MKIRIRGNTLRLRLSKPEVEQVAENGIISDRIRFPTGELTYTLSKEATHEVTAEFQGKEIRVKAPEQTLTEWCSTEMIGFSGTVPLPEGEELNILVEKDFQCTIQRQGEDESDLYDNPVSKSRKEEND